MVDRRGEYVLALKQNQSALFVDVERIIAAAPVADEVAPKAETKHDRFERRRAVVVPATTLAKAHDFPGIRAVAQVQLLRRGKADDVIVRWPT
jgi:hypothetical protein